MIGCLTVWQWPHRFCGFSAAAEFLPTKKRNFSSFPMSVLEKKPPR
jgi:hypothetical protein